MKKKRLAKQPAPPDLDRLEEQRQGLSLRDYQTQHLAAYLNHPSYADLDNPRMMELSDAGTGKTPPCCLYIYAMWMDKGIKTVWVMPKALLRKNWEELLLWSAFRPEEVVIVDGSPQQREAQLQAPEGKVYLCGFDCFTSNWEQFLKLQPRIKMLLGDEWHLGFSTHGFVNERGQIEGTRRTYELYRAMQHIPRMLPMTGTLIAGRLTSAYPAINLIQPRYYGNYQVFLAWHAVLDSYGKPAIWKNHDRLKAVLADHSVRVTFSDVYGEENKLIQIEKCEMSAKQRAAYREMHTTAMLELENDEVLEAAHEAEALLRCIQIMQHPETLDEGIKEDPEQGKTAHCRAWVQTALEASERLVIFETTIAMQQKLAKMARACGARVGVLNGMTPNTGDLDNLFRNHDLDVLIASPECAGVGFNWGFLNRIIFTGLDYRDTTFVQNYRRGVRGVRETPLHIIIMQYTNSIDQRIAQIVNKKSNDRIKVMGESDTAVRIAPQ